MSHRHLVARMRTAKHFEEPQERPHDDWTTFPNYNNADTRDDLTDNMRAQVVHEWHPPHGESFIQYLIHPVQSTDGSGDHTGEWRASHDGMNRGMKTITDRDGNTMTHNNYDWRDSENLGTFRDVDQAKAACEAYHDERYGRQSKPGADYYEDILRRIDEPDEGYDIFGEGR